MFCVDVICDWFRRAPWALLFPQTKQEVERLKAERDQYKTQVVQTEATLRKDSSEKEALLMDERTQLKEELEAARARCLSERAQLEADVDRLRNSTKDGESTTHHLQDALRVRVGANIHVCRSAFRKKRTTALVHLHV